jgi:hypothetical protein
MRVLAGALMEGALLIQRRNNKRPAFLCGRKGIVGYVVEEE